MTQPPSAATLSPSLNAHAAAKGGELRAKYGAVVSLDVLLHVLKDRAIVRYPTEIVFDAGPLLPGELAHPIAQGQRPEDGFTMCVHPHFATQPRRVVFAVVYQLVVVNYGHFASADDAETFGATALGLSKDAYYQALCEMADELTSAESSTPSRFHPDPRPVSGRMVNSQAQDRVWALEAQQQTKRPTSI